MKPEPTKYFHRSAAYQRGFSLIELMIAISLGLFLIFGVTQAFLTSKQTYRLQQGLARIQENGRLAQEFLTYDIRNAGDYGCASGDSFVRGSYSPANPYPDARNDSQCTTNGSVAINMISATTALDDEFEYAVYGFDNVTASTTFTATAPAGGNVTVRLSQAPKAGTDVLMVHTSQDLGITTVIIGNPAATTPTLVNIATLTLNTSNKLSYTTSLVDRIAVGDCATTKIFGVSDMSSASTTLTLANNFCTRAAFAQGATVRKVNAVYYFVSANGRGGYSLYRQVSGSDVTGSNSTAVAQELLEGVEDFQLQFGIDTNGDGLIDLYKSAGDTTGSAPATAAAWQSAWNGWDWLPDPDGNAATKDGTKESTLVRSVRYSILMRTEEDSVLAAPQTISFNGSSIVGGGSSDRRLRQVFTSTIGIRSRGN